MLVLCDNFLGCNDFLLNLTFFLALPLRLHNNGRMLDIFHRLHAPEADFFVPFDLEISNQELSFICSKAEQWRGEEGERRKVAVYDYVWEEEDVSVQYIELNSCTNLISEGLHFSQKTNHSFPTLFFFKIYSILMLP